MTALRTHASVVASYWDAAAPTFDREPDHGLWEESTRAAWARLLARWVPEPPARVLDLGCGTGSLTVLLAAAGHRVTGVDLSPAMVGAARAKLADAGLSGEVLVGDAADPPVPGPTAPAGEPARADAIPTAPSAGPGDGWDAVVVRHLLWTLPDPLTALRRWVSLLRPGGRLVLIEGRWAESAALPSPYGEGAEPLPWAGGVPAEALEEAIRPLVAAWMTVPLSGDPVLWGGPVDDERYAVVARARWARRPEQGPPRLTEILRAARR
ncbi:class I SAM-dependent methyltransferase [Streptomyces calidiresistens]|uniref:Methyltransferase domain-containing protein n=1 Tax=Streptomyces calidiresistens TaxID=1485586 RepID=A0A7W3T2N3_9ACTN|nr:class I SAM-dependent methyltransferase [Streptomyces calidiresistens]MBB0229827.1 methyltransferase domain-containing protein [Streptomyces calidiresistens]